MKEMNEIRVVSRPMAIQILNKYRKHLTPQEYRTCMGQTENDPSGCVRGLRKLLNRKNIEHDIEKI